MYRLVELPYRSIPQFSKRDIAYQEEDQKLRPFYSYPPRIESFKDIIENRDNYQVDRKILVNQIEKLYHDISICSRQKQNIEALRGSDTYTVVTAHQPSLLCGPLYFIYKILSAVKLAEAIETANPGCRIVPIFVLGGEDHDFDEIATLHMFGRDFTWVTDQKGAVSRMSQDGLEAVLTEIKETFGTLPFAEELSSTIDTALAQSGNYGDFMFRLVNALIGDQGVLCLNMDTEEFKQVLLPYVLHDLETGESKQSVTEDQKNLVKSGFKPQAHARDVNLFVHKDGDRLRVIQDGTNYSIGELNLNKEELKDYLIQSVADISPNVVLRPIFQEIVLPNLAYIGGGGELAYWLERKTLFDMWEIPFPALVRRDSVLLIDKRTDKFVNSNKIDYLDLFQREEKLGQGFINKFATGDLSLTEYKRDLNTLYNSIADDASDIDPTLGKTALSEGVKAIKGLDYLASKLMKAQKQKHEISLSKLYKIKNKLFPNGDSLQERYDSFIPFYLKYGKAWFDELKEHLDPLNKDFKILIED